MTHSRSMDRGFLTLAAVVILLSIEAAPVSAHPHNMARAAGNPSATISPASGARYYLVVPRNADSEGSHGTRSDGNERSTGPSQCTEQNLDAGV